MDSIQAVLHPADGNALYRMRWGRLLHERFNDSDAADLFDITGTGPEVARTFRENYGVASAVITCGGDGAVACDDAGDWATTPFTLGQIVPALAAAHLLANRVALSTPAARGPRPSR